jgi:hypothetical protein
MLSLKGTAIPGCSLLSALQPSRYKYQNNKFGYTIQTNHPIILNTDDNEKFPAIHAFQSSLQ